MKPNRLLCTQLLGALSAVLLQAQQPQPPSAAYPTVTDARLEHPDAGDWLMYLRTYDGWGFSPLTEFTSSNIQRLSLTWSMSTDLPGRPATAAIHHHPPNS